MRKSGTLWSFLATGLIAEAIFLILLRVDLSVVYLMNFLTAGTLFMAYRGIADWRYFSNPVQRELLSYIVDLNPTAKMVLSVCGGLILSISNFSLPFSLGEMLFMGTIATFVSWGVIEILRRAEIFYRVRSSEEEKISDVELEEKLQLSNIPIMVVDNKIKGGV